jgi:outer membrane protein OmpA-like peptidoglycan-associated protein
MNVDTKILFLVALLGVSLDAICQQRTKELRGSVNTRSFNDVFPSISGDGNTLVFMNDYSDDGGYITLISRKAVGGKWGEPEELEVLNPARLNVKGGNCLSFDGNTLVYSTRKGETIGGYDLWYMTHDGSKWSNPRNLGFPVNSTQQDSYPSLSPDGNRLFFTRCAAIDGSGGRDCKIFVSKRKRGRVKGWEAPVELGGQINSGNSLLPRMLSDNRTLVYSSDKPGGKGGLDWYYTQMDLVGSWSDPINMDFVNTAEDDVFYSMYYRPDKALTSVKNDFDKYNIVEMDIPEKFQPDKVVIKIGKVLNSNGEPVDSDVRARDFQNGESVTFTFPDTETGEYTLIIPEGSVYDFSIVPKRGNEFYQSDVLDYSSLRSSRKESSDYVLQVPQSNSVLGLNALKFVTQSDDIDPRSDQELARLVRLLNRNETFNLEIAAFQDSIVTDSIPRPELTEVISDTTIWEEFVYKEEYKYQYGIDEDSVKIFPEFTSYQLDSMLVIWNDSLSRVRNDTLLAEILLASLVGDVDTIETIVDTIQHVDIKYTYHNDLTQKRADRLASKLMDLEVAPDRIMSIGYGNSKRPMTALKEEEFEDGFVEIIFRR